MNSQTVAPAATTSPSTTSSSPASPPSPRQPSATPKFVTWIVGLLGAVTVLAMSYKNAVEALDAAKQATVKAFAGEPVAKASYEELTKTVTDLGEQLKATQAELATLADYVQQHPPTEVRSVRAPRVTGPAPSAAATGAPPSPAAVADHARAIEARPLLRPPSFDTLRQKIRTAPPAE